MPAFTFTDALLLYSIAYCTFHDGSASLYGIFRTFDAIDRSAPTYDELRDGLTLLSACGLIDLRDNDYVPTEEGLRLYDALNERDGTVFDHLHALEGELNARYGDCVVEQAIALDEGGVEAARREYYEKQSEA